MDRKTILEHYDQLLRKNEMHVIEFIPGINAAVSTWFIPTPWDCEIHATWEAVFEPADETPEYRIVADLLNREKDYIPIEKTKLSTKIDELTDQMIKRETELRQKAREIDIVFPELWHDIYRNWERGLYR